MTKEMKDFYFSQKSFDFFHNENFPKETVCEAKINGEWKVFTEQISVGKKPLSHKWGDLIYIGRGIEKRYSKYEDWIKNKTS